jgi:glycosyltransferase involved in cell wall biosynthesis
MRVAQVAPLIEPVPPHLYGGTERVVSWLTEELVRRGHEVTLFAAGDSRTKASLEPIRSRSIRLDPDLPDPLAYHVLELENVFAQAERFDVIHCHVDFLAFPFARQCRVPTIHTMHGRLDLPHWPPMIERYPGTPLVSISDSQRRPIDQLGPNWVATIHHGLPDSAIRPGTGKGEYLAFFSRLSREKRPDLAIEVAKRVGLPLKIAGKVDVLDRPYFTSEIEPLLDHPLIEYLGEMGDEKVDFLGDALCMLFPIDWPEPFGLVMIEALACGTPVITRPFGSAPEVIHHGRTGFIVDTVDQMAEAVRRVDRIDRKLCIETVQERFSAEVMCARYESAYEDVMNGKGSRHWKADTRS